MTNKRIWVVDKYAGIPFVSGPWIVTKVRRILPAGPTKSGLERQQTLIDIFTDGGERVVAAATIWMKDPKSALNPW